MNLESEIREMLEQSRTEFQNSAAAVSAVDRAISSAINKDRMSTSSLNGEGDFDKLFGNSKFKFRKNRKSRIHFRNLRPDMHQAYMDYLDAERGGTRSTFIKRRHRLARKPYAAINSGANLHEINRMRSRRKGFKRTLKANNVEIIPSIEESIINMDGAARKSSFQFTANRDHSNDKPGIIYYLV